MASGRLSVISSHLSSGPARSANESSASGGYQCITVSRCGKRNDVGLITLNRPKSLNALSARLLGELCTVLEMYKTDSSIGCVIITGSTKVFSAGADIKEMGSIPVEYARVAGTSDSFVDHMAVIGSFPKPLIAAVNGYCFGGGCEIAMACDVVYAGSDALFGQPEVKIGTIPGGGGTQRLIRTVGKSKAMEMILSGEPITAQQALQFSLVAEVFPTEKLLESVIRKAEGITANSTLITSMAKDCVNKAAELSLEQGLSYEKRIFQATFFTKDRKEGMEAFVSKRRPVYRNE